MVSVSDHVRRPRGPQKDATQRPSARGYPPITPSLIEALRRDFREPKVVPNGNREADLWAAAQAAVVDHLETIMEAQR